MQGMTPEEIERIAATGVQFDPVNDGGERVTGARGTYATKPQDYLRRKPIVTELIDQGIGYLTDQSGNHEVKLQWNLNDYAQKDKIFKLTVDDKEVYIDMEELFFYTRIMFTK